MKYQRLKVRDAGRLLAMGIGLTLVVLTSLRFREQAEPIINALPIGHGQDRYLPILIALGFVGGMCFAMAIWYMLSTPEQNAKFIEWYCHTFRKTMPPAFDPDLLDASDPDYRVLTISYLIRRIGSR